MEVIKTTEKYNFYKDGIDYILDLGSIQKGEDTTTSLLFKGYTNLTVTATCGCTAVEGEKISPTEVRYDIKYKNCDSSFSKVLVVNSKENKFKIKIKGTCR